MIYLTEIEGQLQEANSLLELMLFFNIDITEKGEVIFEDKKDTISYDMTQWTVTEVLCDFAKHRLSKFKTIYKAERL